MEPSRRLTEPSAAPRNCDDPYDCKRCFAPRRNAQAGSNQPELWPSAADLKALSQVCGSTSARSGAMRRIKTFLLIILPVSIAFVAPLRPARCSAPIAPQAPNHQLVVCSGANDEESLFGSEKIGKALFIMLPFAWGVVDWAHPPWYDVVLEAFRG